MQFLDSDEKVNEFIFQAAPEAEEDTSDGAPDDVPDSYELNSVHSSLEFDDTSGFQAQGESHSVQADEDDTGPDDGADDGELAYESDDASAFTEGYQGDLGPSADTDEPSDGDDASDEDPDWMIDIDGVTLEGDGTGTVLEGGELNDYLYSGSGDQLYGGNGRDLLIGGRGTHLFGGNGADELHGVGSGAQLYGGEGDDELNGGGEGTLDGGNGNDQLYGQGSETLYGGEGNDALNGGGGSIVYGGSGSDTLWGSGDTLYGGEGNDVFIWERGGSDNVIVEADGEGSHDVLRVDVSAGDVTLKTLSNGDIQIIIKSSGQEDCDDGGTITIKGGTGIELVQFKDAEWDLLGG